MPEPASPLAQCLHQVPIDGEDPAALERLDVLNIGVVERRQRSFAPHRVGPRRAIIQAAA